VAKGKPPRGENGINKTINVYEGMSCNPIGMRQDEIRMPLISDAFGQRALQGAAAIEQRDITKVQYKRRNR